MDERREIAAYAARFRADRAATARPPLPGSLAALEAEAIFILRETAAAFERPVLLYSIGKDSTVMLHLALKAFWPAPPPFPLLHVDSGWEFAVMASFRDELVGALGLKLIVHRNPEASAIDPFRDGVTLHTRVACTQALVQAIGRHGFDAAIGGGRRDEEQSRAKERIFSVRDPQHGWNPRRQRPEFWHILNASLAAGETMRVFPLSNWSEEDVWRYIAHEKIPVVPLYMADLRPTVVRDDIIIMVDDDRFPLAPGEQPQWRQIRFRTLGCYPFTGAILSDARSAAAIVEELRASPSSERAGRIIDLDGAGAMERKKRQGHF